MLLYQISASVLHGKISKNHIKTINLKYKPRRGMKSLNCLIDHILYHIELLNESGKQSMEVKHLRTLALEIFKTLNNLNPNYIKEIFFIFIYGFIN